MVETRSQAAGRHSSLSTCQLSHVLVPSFPITREPSPQISSNRDVAAGLVELKAPSVSSSEASTSHGQVTHAKQLLSAKTLPTPPYTVLSSPVEISTPTTTLIPTFCEPSIASPFQDQVTHAKALLPPKTVSTPSSMIQVGTIPPTTNPTPPLSEPLPALTPPKQIAPANPSLPITTARLPPLHSPLLRLPVELRTRIYALAFTIPTPIQITPHPRPPDLHPPTAHLHPTFLAATPPHYRLPLGGTSALSLALTSRQLYHESTPLYYARNTFQYTSYGPARHHFHAWLRVIGPAHRLCVRNIHFVVDGDCRALVDLGHLPALRRLTIVLGWPADRCRWSGVPKEALMGLARMSPSLETVVLRYEGPVRGSEVNVALRLNERDVEEVNEVLRVERGRGGG